MQWFKLCSGKPILTLGRQQPDSDVFVFSPTVHVNEEGKLIPFIDQKYVWVNEIISKECVLPNEYLTIKELPTCELPFKTFLEGLQKLTQANFPSALFVAGKWWCKQSTLV